MAMDDAVRKIDREGDVNSSESEEDEEKMPDVKLQKKFKDEFLKAANEEREDEDLLVVKKKSKAEVEEEKREMQEMKKKEEEAQKEFKKTFKKNETSKEDAFLRDYILGKVWRERGDSIDEKVD